MRRILVDRVRQRRTARHGGDRDRVELLDVWPVAYDDADQLLALA